MLRVHLNIPLVFITYLKQTSGGNTVSINPLNAELNPICHLLALGAHHILHVSRIRVNVVGSSAGNTVSMNVVGNSAEMLCSAV